MNGTPHVLPGYFGVTALEAARVDAVLKLLSADVETLQLAVVDEQVKLGELGVAWAFSAFGQYPLVRLGDGSVIVLSPKLLLQRVFGWPAFFDVREHLRAIGGNAGKFEQFFRKLTEHYVREVLDSIAPAVAGEPRVFSEDALRAAYRGPGVKLADAVIEYPDAWVIVEISTHQLQRDAVAGVSDAALATDMERLVDSKAAQLASTIGCLRHDESRLTGRPAVPRRFFLVIVAAEGFPVNPMASELAAVRLRARSLLTEPDVAPLELVDTVMLEMVEGVQETGGPSLCELLERKQHGSLARCSLRDFLLVEARLPCRLPRRVDALCTRPFDDALSLMFPSDAA